MKKQILDLLNTAKSVLIVGHVKPDGDCIGACLAMREYCMEIGIDPVNVAVPSNIPDSYAFLEDAGEFNKISRGKFDVFMALDCANIDRFNRLDVFYKTANTTICIDHHMGNEGFGDLNMVNPDASSCCEILFDLLEDTGLINKKIANYLMVGLSSDTGHFMHNNVTPKVLSTACKLSELGADIHNIATKLYRTRSKEKTALLGRSLSGIRYFENGKVAVIINTLDDLAKCGVTCNDTEGLIDYAISVKDAVIAVCICEETKGQFKVSFRSHDADVNEIAKDFGGGGHIHAAGCKLSGEKEEVINKILEAIGNHW